MRACREQHKQYPLCPPPLSIFRNSEVWRGVEHKSNKSDGIANVTAIIALGQYSVEPISSTPNRQ